MECEIVVSVQPHAEDKPRGDIHLFRNIKKKKKCEKKWQWTFSSVQMLCLFLIIRQKNMQYYVQWSKFTARIIVKKKRFQGLKRQPCTWLEIPANAEKNTTEEKNQDQRIWLLNSILHLEIFQSVTCGVLVSAAHLKTRTQKVCHFFTFLKFLIKYFIVCENKKEKKKVFFIQITNSWWA